jgi:hypothetical protein
MRKCSSDTESADRLSCSHRSGLTWVAHGGGIPRVTMERAGSRRIISPPATREPTATRGRRKRTLLPHCARSQTHATAAMRAHRLSHPVEGTADGSAADLGGRSALRLASTAHETARREAEPSAGCVGSGLWSHSVVDHHKCPPPGADLGLAATSLSSVSRPIVGTQFRGKASRKRTVERARCSS